MIKFWKLYRTYAPLGKFKAVWSVVRIFILPFWKIDRFIGHANRIVDVGCGNGALANYLAISDPSREIFGVDLSKSRISEAKKTIINSRNTKFVYGNVVSKKIPLADSYLICDVLHHIDYGKQVPLLKQIAGKLKSKSVLVLKDVDPSNKLPFLFGHLWERFLYPHEDINVRTRKDWSKVLKEIGLTFKIETGAFYFPDSTLIFICRKMNKH